MDGDGNGREPLGAAAVAKMLGLHRRTLERMVLAGLFPPPMRVGLSRAGRRIWLRRTVETWIDRQEKKALAGYRRPG